MGKSFVSLEKAIQILSLFDAENRELSAQEISEKLSIPLSTTYNYIKVFIANKFLEKNEITNKFCLGFNLFKLGILAAKNNSLIEITRPHLISMAERSQETAVLTISDEMDVLCVDTIESPRLVKLTIKNGVRLPLHAGAPGKAVLAFKSRSFLHEMIQKRGLDKMNKNTITNVEELEQELESIRTQGFSTSNSEVDLGAGSLSVPIFDYNTHVIASISLVGSAESIFREEKQEFIAMLKETALKISAELGYIKG